MRNPKLTPNMLGGLARMALDARRDTKGRGVLPHPNNLTGKALANRGMVRRVMRPDSPWDYYQITEAGWKVLEQEDLLP